MKDEMNIQRILKRHYSILFYVYVQTGFGALWSHWHSVSEVVLVVWVCAVPSEAAFSAWTGVGICAIPGTSVTGGSFPQYVQPYKVCTHTYADTLWPTTHHSVLLKASFMWNFPISLQAFLPSVNKQLKFLSKHTSIFHNLHSIQSKVILIIQFT